MDLRALPSVDILLQSEAGLRLSAEYGRPLTVQGIRSVLDTIRTSSTNKPVPGPDEILERTARELAGRVAATVLPVINTSGVILHTNLGRAPLSQAAIQAACRASAAYTNLEYDLDTGKRSSRQLHCENLVKQLTGAEAALVVNNNAAAVLLVLSAMARRKRVIISRTQLVEIGGGFRVPEVMAQSGARLVEVGTTNRVHPADYEDAFREPAAAILRAHPSNFRISGYTSEVSLTELAGLAHKHNALLVDDLGSGALLDTARFGLAHEPTVQESLAAGADLVCFSGDKLLGGPQAGIIAGKKAHLDKICRHPLVRAIRCDKVCLAGLSATLIHYLKDEAEKMVPVWQMISMPPEVIRTRAESWQGSLRRGQVVPGRSTVGGGSMPGETLPTFLLGLEVRGPDRLMAALRRGTPPVIARIQDGLVLMDPRTVFPDEDAGLIAALQSALQ